MPRFDAKTLAELRLEARRLADQQTDDEATARTNNDDLDASLNEALRQLWDLILLAYGHEDYGRQTRLITVVGQELYPLPDDFLQVLDVRAALGPDGVRWRAMDTWALPERSRLLNLSGSTSRYRYRVRELALAVLPVPVVAGDLIDVDYTPVPPKLVHDDESWTFGYTKWATLTVAADIATGEENYELAGARLSERAEIEARLKRLQGERNRARPERIIDTRRDNWWDPGFDGNSWGDDEVF